jgi:nitrite reductase/ring-hydroxylating ferredoxin subunit
MSPDESVNASLICRSGLPDGGLVAREVVIDGEKESIIVHRDGNAVRAWLNICPHQGRRLDYVPGKFLLDRGRLVCAAHGASFELGEGRCVAGPCLGDRLRAVPLAPAGSGVDGTFRVADALPEAAPGAGRD